MIRSIIPRSWTKVPQLRAIVSGRGIPLDLGEFLMNVQREMVKKGKFSASERLK